MFICENHFVEKNFKILLKKQGVNNTCAVCKAENNCLNTESFEARSLFKAMVRYNFDEVSYNRHFGGDHFESFILEPNFVFNNDINNDGELYSELDGELSDMGYYVADEISLFAGYSDGTYNMPYMSIKNTPETFIENLQKKLEVNNYHKFEDELIDVIKSYGNSFCTIIEGSSFTYRARVGSASCRIAHQAFSREGKKIFEPFSHKEIGAVPPLKATEGRANRAGVSYLYCATDGYTAVAEVRPHPTDIVSLGSFSTTRALKVFDFSNPNFLNFIVNDETLLTMVPYAKMAGIFNTATPPSLAGRYSVSQLIADCIRKSGYDGIQFSSTVGDGKNLVVFNPSDMSFVEGSSKVIEINKVQYSYTEKPVLGIDDHQELYFD
jgi:hypothetical protein